MPTFLRTTGWCSPPVVPARRAGARRRGLRPRSDRRALLLRAQSVHGFGMKEALWVVGLDEGGTVVGIRLLRPRRVVRLAAAMWLLELSAALAPPPMGAILRPASSGSG